MVNCTSSFRSSFRHAHLPWWEARPGQDPSYTTTSGGLVTMPDTHDSSSFPPASCPLTPVETHIQSPRIEPDSIPTFTNPDILDPRVVKATNSMRLRARAVIWQDVYGMDGSKDDEMILPPSRRQRIRARVERKMHSVHHRLEKRVEKVEHIAFRRTYLRVKRSVKKITPLKNYLKGIARSMKGFEAFTHTQWNVSTATLAKSIFTEPGEHRSSSESQRIEQRTPRNSTASLIRPAITGVDKSIASGELPESETSPGLSVRGNSEGVDDLAAPVTVAAVTSKESLFSWESGDDLSDLDVRVLLDQFHRHTQEQLAKATESCPLLELPFGRSTSISAQIAAFQFSTLVPLDIFQGFAPTHRVILKTSNTVLAQHDLIQLSHIWSQVMDCAPSPLSLDTDQLLQVLSDTDAEKMCQLMEEALHRYLHWGLLTEVSVKENEGTVDQAWWTMFKDKLDSIGYPAKETLSKQLILVGSKYINVEALKTAMASAKVGKFPDSTSVCQDGETKFVVDENELAVPVQEEEVITPERTDGILAQQAKILSATEPPSQNSAPMRQLSTTAVPLPILRNKAGERIIAPFRNFRLTSKVATPVDVAKEETPCPSSEEKAAHAEKLTWEIACNSSLPIEEPSSTEIALSFSDIMKEVMAYVDAAIEDPVLSPEPTMESRPPQFPPSLTIRRSQPALPKQNSIEEKPSPQIPLPIRRSEPALPKPKSAEVKPSLEKRRDSLQEKAASVPITYENGWISAEDLQDFRPEDVVYPEVVYVEPSHISNKARRKLPMPRTVTPSASPVAARKPARSQAVSVAAPASRNVKRTASLQAVKTPSSVPVRAATGSKTSRIPPPPTKTRTASQDAAVGTSIPASKAETVQVAPRSTVPIAVVSHTSTRSTPAALALGVRPTKIPVPTRVQSRKLHIPGMYPAETIGGKAEE